MNGRANACLLTLSASLVLGSACTRPATSVDLLARRPDEHEGATGVHVSLPERRVRLEPGAEVRYRIEHRVSGEVRLEARAEGEGTLEAAWFLRDRVTGTETPGQRWQIAADRSGTGEHVLPLPPREGLAELRLTWRASSGPVPLELLLLTLHEESSLAKPSIVLIVIDTLSARHLSTYGYPLETDPELARLASESFVFERCFSNATWTVPSFMALMSGIYARAHELHPRGRALWQQWHLSHDRWTLAECLRAAGYRTAGFVDNPWLSPAFGLAQGFDVYDASAGEGELGVQGQPEGGIRRTTALAREFLRARDPEAPFLLFVHAFDAHGPYLARPSSWPQAMEGEPYDLERTRPAGGSPQAFGIIPTYIARGAVPAGELPERMPTAPFERAYDAGVRFVDEELGKFLAFLRAEGILERSWLVFTADHGEAMADSTVMFGHNVLDQDVTRVPLVIRPPGGCPGGKRIPELVQLVDLYPTLVELVGLEPGGASGLHGRSLAPLLGGARLPPAPILVETGITRQAMLVDGSWMLVELEPSKDLTEDVGMLSHPLLRRQLPALVELEADAERGKRALRWLDDAELERDYFERMPASGPTEALLAEMRMRAGFPLFRRFVERLLEGPFYELYDLAHDPEAEHDVAAQHPEKLAALKELLKREQQRRRQAWKLAAAPTRQVELSPEDVRALDALGYGGPEREAESE